MLLDIDHLHAYYGKSHILHGVRFTMPEPRIVALLGRNGAGRSTTLKAMMGLVPPSQGKVALNGEDLAGRPAHVIARRGLGYVPEERQVFPNLTVEENLMMGMQTGAEGAPRWQAEDMYQYFPRLRERRNQKAGYMSGGEQQMLTICRSLLGNPLVLLVDEPTEGLAPMIVQVVMDVIRDIHQRGVGVLLVEQKMTMALRVASHVLVMGHGQIVFTGSTADMQARDDIRRDWLEVA
ncbi:ABC transporter ATP-binding protein [Alloalcanivorax xenomutans]|jgi:branched-chain amino acid transport system ATP-binding protein|uniref:ABC transporter n=2 Tax=Alcanivoracaceae TaxID=224372 RepID=A0ABQ6YCR9_9GAMM|nr:MULTISPECIES: ABC transporter ATP-binding protein [Alcanivoracaceae]ERS11882.1 mannosyltransferase [Alcanivorax sp. PN-3]KYZ84291.1 ABC transporter ATP-binding protein [Alcanivorax sp. KX64203]MBA4720460.1 ABC transporter ATP-binding protein [Alcanivorax sp.]KAF0808007.1 ABC transporter [Alcanivorax xiamenensis]PHS68856.1 MAG: ABC transporter ATP-binding protein [Alcanivorax sp.]